MSRSADNPGPPFDPPRKGGRSVAASHTTQDLAQKIRKRIEHRLGDRIRNLDVQVRRGEVHLAGRCSTYYAKQLALHATLGVLEDERIENAIVVAPAH